MTMRKNPCSFCVIIYPFKYLNPLIWLENLKLKICDQFQSFVKWELKTFVALHPRLLTCFMLQQFFAHVLKLRQISNKCNVL